MRYVFRARVSPATSFGIDNMVCPEKAPDEAKLANASWSVINCCNPALIEFESILEAWPNAELRPATCTDWLCECCQQLRDIYTLKRDVSLGGLYT